MEKLVNSKRRDRQAGSNSHVIDLAAKASTFGKSQEEPQL
jgi:hypothetical protein